MSKMEVQDKESNCIDAGNYGIFKEKGGGKLNRALTIFLEDNKVGFGGGVSKTT